MPGRAPSDGDSARGIALRPSTPGDAPFLTRVYASTRPVEVALFASSPVEQEAFIGSQSSLQRRAYAEQFPGSAFEIVLVDGQPAGRLFVARTTSELRVVDIALLGEYRGAGIGTYLLRGVLAEAAARRIAVGLEVDLENPARRLYARLGFVLEAVSEIQASLRWTPAGTPPLGPSGVETGL